MFIRWAFVAALAVTAAGCGVSKARLEEAKGHVARGLEAWKNGGKPEDLKSGAKPIEFHDGNWSAGTVLVGYETGAVTYSDRDRVARCEVRLTVRPAKGKERTETTFYDVTLSEPIKVVNNPMP